MRSILDPAFQYTSSVNTDIRKTFAKVRREMKARAAKATQVDGRNVLALPASKAKDAAR